MPGVKPFLGRYLIGKRQSRTNQLSIIRTLQQDSCAGNGIEVHKVPRLLRSGFARGRRPTLCRGDPFGVSANPADQLSIYILCKNKYVPVVELDTIKASDADMLSSPNRQRSTIYSVFGFYPSLYLVVTFMRNRDLHLFYTRTDKMLPVRDCMYNPKLYRSSVLNAFLYSKINTIFMSYFE